jgi:hypothetical protein
LLIGNLLELMGAAASPAVATVCVGAERIHVAAGGRIERAAWKPDTRAVVLTVTPVGERPCSVILSGPMRVEAVTWNGVRLAAGGAGWAVVRDGRSVAVTLPPSGAPGELVISLAAAGAGTRSD